MADKRLSLYMHVPFCKSKCGYCDFNSFPGKERLVPDYFEALKREIGYYSKKLAGYKIKTLFIGGGTPSYVDARYIYETVNFLRQNAEMEEGAEITIESNPGTLTYEKLLAYRDIGVNRLSIGLQSYQDHILKKLGRIHTAEEFAENFKLVKKAGFRNVNVDLMFGIPGQNRGEWAHTLSKTIELRVPHISCYSLKIEEESLFGKLVKEGGLTPADEETDRDMYRLAVGKLEKSGFTHYEISNFSIPGFECRHNLVYWRAESYIGLGAGAHSYFMGKRYNNIYSVEKYMESVSEEGVPEENVEEIGKREEMSEYMMLGFRLVEGISGFEFKRRFGEDLFSVYGAELERLQKRHLVELSGDGVRLTDLGLDLANQVFMEFV